MAVDRQAGATTFPASLHAAIGDLPPAYFALVMATGIVSVAADSLGQPMLARGMFYLNIVFYVVLAGMHVARLILFPRRCLANLHDPTAGPGYFTWIAGTDILATQFIVFEGAYFIAAGLFALALALSVAISYTVLAALALRQVKPTLDKGINGGWLISIVAMQSLVIVATRLGEQLGQPVLLELHFLALAMWLAGILLYFWIGLLLFYRCFFFVISPTTLMPTFWISMGALAISTLAGSALIMAGGQGDAPYLHSLLPFIKGLTVLCWAGGSWWIPLLVIMGVWRHGVRRVPLRYEPFYWGFVFPLGMYSFATWHIIQTMHLPFLRPLPIIFHFAAIVAWAVVLMGLIHHILMWLRDCR